MILGNMKTKNVAAHRAMMRILSQLTFFFMSLAFDYGTKIRDFAVTQSAGNFRRLKKLFRMSFWKIPTGLLLSDNRTISAGSAKVKRKADPLRDPPLPRIN
jgi:hypothetical protein